MIFKQLKQNFYFFVFLTPINRSFLTILLSNKESILWAIESGSRCNALFYTNRLAKAENG